MRDYWRAYWAELERLDARQCRTGYACGSACISLAKECRKTPKAATGKERLRRIQELAAGGSEGRGLGRLRQSEAAGKLTQLQEQRRKQAQELIGQRQQRRQSVPPKEPETGPTKVVKNPPLEARRTKENIDFPKPIEGPSGAKLVAYQWQWMPEEYVDKRGEDKVKRVSDWDKAEKNIETGRDVVHQFVVEVDGQQRVVSAESAVKLLGFTDPADRKQFNGVKNAARSVARLRMVQHELKGRVEQWQKDRAEVDALKPPEPVRGPLTTDPDGKRQRIIWKMGDVAIDQVMFTGSPPFNNDREIRAFLESDWRIQQMEARGWAPYDATYEGGDRLQRELTTVGARLRKAEQKLQTADQVPAEKPERDGKPTVKVEIRRAKPGGEYGPDGHWYAGGAWMSQGKFVGSEAAIGEGEGSDVGQKDKSKGNERVRVIRNRAPEPLPIEPKGEGLPQPKGLKKRAKANDEEFFNERGYIRKEAIKKLGGWDFTAAVAQRLTPEELKLGLRMARENADDPKWFDEEVEWLGRHAEQGFGFMRSGGKLSGISDEHFRLAAQFTGLDYLLRPLSPARQRRQARAREYESTVQTRDGEQAQVWFYNNLFRYVRQMRERKARGDRTDSAYRRGYLAELNHLFAGQLMRVYANA